MINKILEWLEKANKDLEAAKILLEKIPEISAYHSQQAVEKYLKAYLVSENKDFPKTHNIYFLLELCIELDSKFKKLRKIGIEKLTRYAFVRYPGTFSVDMEEAKKALEIAEKVKDFISKKIKQRIKELKNRRL